MAVFGQLDLWRLAGKRSYERGEQYVDAVGELREVVDGVVATVQGTELYQVRLSWASPGLTGECSCPFSQEGEFCKHCVAVGLAVIDAADDPADELDEDELDDGEADRDDEADSDEADSDEADPDEADPADDRDGADRAGDPAGDEVAERDDRGSFGRAVVARAAGGEEVRRYLAGLDHATLVELLCTRATQDAELARALLHQAATS